MPYRKIPLANNEIYHIYNKSIAEYKIFNSSKNYGRMLKSIIFHTLRNTPNPFYLFLELKERPSVVDFVNLSSSEKIVKIIAYCIMSTHYHLIIQQLTDKGISRFVNSFQKSYSEFFNKKYKRKGPLWEGRFQNVLVDSNEYFLHLTRYIHLNPVTAGLVNKPEEWFFSSYVEYLNLTKKCEKICDFRNYFNMNNKSYKKFVNDHIDYQKSLAKIKHLLLE